MTITQTAKHLSELYDAYYRNAPVQHIWYMLINKWEDYQYSANHIPDFHVSPAMWRVKPKTIKRPIQISELPPVFIMKSRVSSLNPMGYEDNEIAVMRRDVFQDTLDVGASEPECYSWSIDGTNWISFLKEDIYDFGK